MSTFFNLTTAYSLLILINIVFAFTVIFMEKKNPGSAWAWLMVLLFLPGVGFILYLFIGQNLHRTKMFKLKADEDAISKALIKEQDEQLKKNLLHFNDSVLQNYQAMMRMLLINDTAYITQDNAIEMITDGNEKFYNLLEDMDHAKEHIHMTYYIIKNDDLSRKIIHKLTEKAREGVQVKLIYDALGGRTLTKKFFKDLIAAGGEVVAFFPSTLKLINPRINFRNHRKIAVIDGKIGYVGGFNIGEEYISKSKKFGYWRDTHTRIMGSAVYSLQIRFLLDWRYCSKKDILILDSYFPLAISQGDANIQIVSSGPDSEHEQIKYGYLAMIHAAKKSICIQSPYFIPDDSVLEALKIACLSGLDVKIMVPSFPDHPFVFWANRSYIWELLEVGATAYAYTRGFLHAKTIVVDEQVCSVGTANWDVRSFKLNFEVNAFIYDTDFSEKMNTQFLEDMYHCQEITLNDFKNRSLFQKFKESISRLLSPIL